MASKVAPEGGIQEFLEYEKEDAKYPALARTSCGFMKRAHPLRKKCISIMRSRTFDAVIMFFIITNSIVMAMSDYRVKCLGRNDKQGATFGQPDPSLYIFQSGIAHSVDGCGDEEYIAVGMILSNIEFKQVAKRVGVPTKQLVIKIVACRGLPTQNGASARLLGASPCDPYVEAVVISKTVFGQSVKTCATKVRKFTCDPEYKETFTLKAYQNTETALVSAIHWRRGLAGKKLGTAEIAVKEKYKRPMWHKLLNDAGKKVGDVKVKCEFNALERSGIASTAELTVVADSFCHLYFLDFRSQDIVKKYIKGMRLNLTKRLEGLSGGGAADWRPEEAALDAMTNGDDEMSLCSNHQNSRGFEAYMSEAFSKRSTKGSVMQVSDNRRRSSLGGKQGGGGGGRDKKGPRGTVSHADDKGKVVPVK